MAQAEVIPIPESMDRAAWLELRRRGIGGSDAAAVAGVSRWKSAVEVWLDKTGQLPDEAAESEAAYWGRVLEDVVADEFCRRTGKKVRRRRAILVHPEHSFMIADVDRLVVGEQAGFEAKTTSAYSVREWEEGVPAEYELQCQHYMAVTGLPRWYIGVLVGGQRFVHKVVERDEEVIAYLIRIESEFWKLVETKTPPPLDGSESSARVLEMRYPKAEPGSVIELPPTAEELISEFEQAAQAERAAVERKETAANRLKEMLGKAEVGLCAGRRVTWRTVVSQRLDTKALREARPEVYDEFARESVTRRFQIL